jgi:biopolymer transport protein ExbD
MAAASVEEDGLFGEINVTPLVDISLVLLIIFMVAAPMMVTAPSIKVELPKAASGDEAQKTTVALSLLRDPAGGYQLFLNGKKAAEEEVRSELPSLVRRNPDLQAIVAADKGIAYGDVMHVVDLVKLLGVHKFALDVDPAP